jgi:kynurenine formamidase
MCLAETLEAGHRHGARAGMVSRRGLLLGADRYGIENLANLGRVPPRGAEATVGVIPWEEGSGGPCRVLARW